MSDQFEMHRDNLVRLEVICDRLDRMDEHLFGNGQPGVLDKINSRLRRLEIALATGVGGGAVIMWIIEHLRK